MKPERWQQIKGLYESALRCDEGKRASFLDQACGGDPALRRELESLLAYENREDGFIETPALEVAARALTEEKAESLVGRQLALKVLPEVFARDAERLGRFRRAKSMERSKTSEWRFPWWMYLAGLSYLVTFGLFLYVTFLGPAELRGFVVTFSGDAMVIQSVEADSQVGRGGLRAGDRVVLIDDRPVGIVRDWTEATGNLQAGRAQRWVVSRGDDRVTLEIVPAGASLQSRLSEGYVQYFSLLLPGYFLGLLIAWKRPADPVARIGAWFIITASMAFGFPVGWAVAWRALPTALQLLLWIPQLSRFVLEAIFLSFFVLFPRRLVARRWVWFAIWLPVLATLPWRVKAFYGVIHPGQTAPIPGWILQAGFVRTMLYMLIGIVVLAMSYRRFLDTNEKRRVRVLMVGTAVSLVAAIVMVWFDTFLGRMSSMRAVLFVIMPFNSAAILCLAYAILRHRVLDISVIIRQGLQYALARGGVIGFLPALGALFIFDLAINRQERLADIFQNRGWLYSVAAALSLLAYWKRREWLESIDRRFFRERYNAQQVLRDVVGEIRGATDFQEAAARVVERIETAFHPEFVSVMVHAPGEREYRAVATRPSEQAPPHLSAESKLVGLLHLLGKPLEFQLGSSSWLDQRLPQEEIEFVRRARIDLLVSIASGPTQTEALLALGIKRSEEPYTARRPGIVGGHCLKSCALTEAIDAACRPTGRVQGMSGMWNVL